MTEQFERVQFNPDEYEHPPDAKTLVLRHRKSKVIRIDFLCPCGCNEWRSLPTQQSRHKTKWNFRLKDGKITITPSIRHLNRCKSHYFITENRVTWV